MARLEIKFSDRVGSYHVVQAQDGFKHEDHMDAPKLSNLVYRKIFDQILKSGSAVVEISTAPKVPEAWEDGGCPFEKEIDEKYATKWNDR